MGEERLCRVELEFPTVCGGEVYLVKAAACDPKELSETCAGVRKASLDPIVPQARFLPVQSELGLAIGSVLFVLSRSKLGRCPTRLPNPAYTGACMLIRVLP